MIIDDADFDPFHDLDMLDLGVLPERPYGVRGHFPSADKVKNYHARLLFANVHGITGRDGERDSSSSAGETIGCTRASSSMSIGASSCSD